MTYSYGYVLLILASHVRTLHGVEERIPAVVVTLIDVNIEVTSVRHDVLHQLQVTYSSRQKKTHSDVASTRTVLNIPSVTISGISDVSVAPLAAACMRIVLLSLELPHSTPNCVSSLSVEQTDSDHTTDIFRWSR